MSSAANLASYHLRRSGICIKSCGSKTNPTKRHLKRAGGGGHRQGTGTRNVGSASTASRTFEAAPHSVKQARRRLFTRQRVRTSSCACAGVARGRKGARVPLGRGDDAAPWHLLGMQQRRSGMLRYSQNVAMRYVGISEAVSRAALRASARLRNKILQGTHTADYAVQMQLLDSLVDSEWRNTQNTDLCTGLLGFVHGRSACGTAGQWHELGRLCYCNAQQTGYRR